MAYAISFVRTSGTPMLAAATSSSRTAIQARPRRESRSRKLTNSASSTSPSAVQYHGRRLSGPNWDRPGRSGESTGVMPWRPAVSAYLPMCRSWPLTATLWMISPNASVTMAM